MREAGRVAGVARVGIAAAHGGHLLLPRVVVVVAALATVREARRLELHRLAGRVERWQAFRVPVLRVGHDGVRTGVPEADEAVRAVRGAVGDVDGAARIAARGDDAAEERGRRLAARGSVAVRNADASQSTRVGLVRGRGRRGER